jgi:ABC-2 type transport system ATP-binding protein
MFSPAAFKFLRDLKRNNRREWFEARRDVYENELRTPLRELLEELEIANKRDALPGELSRGMKQKLAIACGLLHSPKVIYFDEPLTGLDPLGIRRMKDSILKRARAGAAIIISSHLLHLVEETCSRILILKNGRKIADGTLAEITQKFSEQPGDANLEEIFFRATSETNAGAPVAPPPLPH